MGAFVGVHSSTQRRTSTESVTVPDRSCATVSANASEMSESVDTRCSRFSPQLPIPMGPLSRIVALKATGTLAVGASVAEAATATATRRRRRR